MVSVSLSFANDGTDAPATLGATALGGTTDFLLELVVGTLGGRFLGVRRRGSAIGWSARTVPSPRGSSGEAVEEVILAWGVAIIVFFTARMDGGVGLVFLAVVPTIFLRLVMTAAASALLLFSAANLRLAIAACALPLYSASCHLALMESLIFCR